jgi:hypothetical protein
MSSKPAFLKLPELPVTPWSGLDQLPQRPEEFSFALLSDRTGLPKPGVFERAISATNLLRPDFVIHIGDAIEGYTRNPETLAAEWAEFDTMVNALEVPLFRVPGNHDVSNAHMQADWLRRFGALHYHFRYCDVLFLILNTQDPPQTLADFGDLDKMQNPDGADADLDMDKLRRVYDADPREFARNIERSMNLEERQPANIGAEQAAWAEQVVREHADVRWTFICMHMPAWQGEFHPALERIRQAMKGRPYTAFAGHLHNYQRRVIGGCDHIRLGPTGGAWVTTKEEGNFDHIAWISMTKSGPRIANLVLDGILGADGGAFRPAPMFANTTT